MRLWGGIAAVAMTVAACGENPLASLSAGGTKTAQTEITVTADRIVLRGPTGFCVDPVSSQHRPSQAFVVFGNCASIAGNDELPQPFVNAVATATVLPSGKGVPSIAASEVALAQYFASNVGRATLSGSGDPSTVEILDSFNRNGAFFIHARDTSGSVLPGADNTFWRGYFDVKNSIVAVSVIGLKSTPLTSADGLQTLYDFANAILERQTPADRRAALQQPKTSPNDGSLERLFG